MILLHIIHCQIDLGLPNLRSNKKGEKRENFILKEKIMITRHLTYQQWMSPKTASRTKFQMKSNEPVESWL